MVVKEARLNISVKLIVVMPQVRENEHKNWYDVKASTDFEFFFEYNSLKLSLYMRIFSIFFLAKIQQQQQHHHHLVSAFRGLSALSISFLLLPMNSKWHYWGSEWLVCDILRKIFNSWMLLSFSICTLLFFGISMVFSFISISAHKCDYVFDSTSYETSTVTESNFIRLDSLCVCVCLCVCVKIWLTYLSIVLCYVYIRFVDFDERLAASCCGFGRFNDRLLEEIGANEIKRRWTRSHFVPLYSFVDVTTGARAYSTQRWSFIQCFGRL